MSANQTANIKTGVSLKHPFPSSVLSQFSSSLLYSPCADIESNICYEDAVPSVSVASAVVKMLEEMGVQYAFGISGGAIAPLWHSLENSSIQVIHFRHEAGAAFAATEAHFTSDRPVVVFTTAGPGITNALTGLYAARWEGAKVIFLSPSTSASQRGMWAFQETSAYTMPTGDIFTSGKLFHYATTLESGEQLPEIARRLVLGLARPGGFVAHLSLPTAVQTSTAKTSWSKVQLKVPGVTVSEETVAECAELLSQGKFAIWVGFGARDAAKEIRQLAETTKAQVMCSPRGKGIFPEDHPQFIGSTGFAGQQSVLTYMQQSRPLHTLVLGTRLGEFTSFWNPAMIPLHSFLHVDIDPEVPGAAYPTAQTIAIQSDVKLFLRSLLKHLPKSPISTQQALPKPEYEVVSSSNTGAVRPEVLMNAIQQLIVEGSDALIIAEAGNSFAWGNYLLRFAQPKRYRVSTGFGAMGHAVTGVVGAALARNGKAVAIVGDGAMLMNSEVSTAVKYKIPAVWIVLNDSRYNMCAQGTTMQGFNNLDIEIPQADFVKIAQGMGADGIRIETEAHIQLALEKAMLSPVPFVVDVVIDPTRPAPIGSRIENLILQNTSD